VKPTIRWLDDAYRMVREGRCSLGGRVWSWSGSRRFGRGPRVCEMPKVPSPRGRDRDGRLSVTTPVLDSGEQATPTRRAVQAQTCEVDFATRDVDTPPVPRFDSDPMQLEAMLC
jgi:hypothetical protein